MAHGGGRWQYRCQHTYLFWLLTLQHACCPAAEWTWWHRKPKALALAVNSRRFCLPPGPPPAAVRHACAPTLSTSASPHLSTAFAAFTHEPASNPSGRASSGCPSAASSPRGDAATRRMRSHHVHTFAWQGHGLSAAEDRAPCDRAPVCRVQQWWVELSVRLPAQMEVPGRVSTPQRRLAHRCWNMQATNH